MHQKKADFKLTKNNLVSIFYFSMKRNQMKRDYFAVTYEEQNAQVPFPATQITPEKSLSKQAIWKYMMKARGNRKRSE